MTSGVGPSTNALIGEMVSPLWSGPLATSMLVPAYVTFTAHGRSLQAMVWFFPPMVTTTLVMAPSALGCDRLSPSPLNSFQGVADWMDNDPSKTTIGVSPLALPMSPAADRNARIIPATIPTCVLCISSPVNG